MHEQSIDLQQAQPLKAEWVQSPGMLMPNPYVLQKTRPENDGRMENGTMQDVLLRRGAERAEVQPAPAARQIVVVCRF